MEELIKLGTKEYTVKKVLYKDLIGEIRTNPNTDQFTALFRLSTGMSDEDYNQLSLFDGLKLQKAVNSINDLDENVFQTPVKEEKTN